MEESITLTVEINENGIYLSWSSLESLISVERSLTGFSSSFNEVARLRKRHNFLDMSVLVNTTYYYRVRGIGNINSDYSNFCKAKI